MNTTKQAHYTKAIKLDAAHPYPLARRAYHSAVTTTLGLALIGGLCCSLCGCCGIIFAQRALVNVRRGDMERAKKLVYTSYVCSLGAVITFAIFCLLLVTGPIAYIRIVYFPDD